MAEQGATTDGPPFALPDFSYAQLGLRPGVDLLDREQVAELQGDNALA